MSKRISQAEIDRRISKGATIKTRSSPTSTSEPNKKLEHELEMVKQKLSEISSKPQDEKKKKFEFTVERDGSGFIKKIHAEEV